MLCLLKKIYQEEEEFWLKKNLKNKKIQNKNKKQMKKRKIKKKQKKKVKIKIKNKNKKSILKI